MPQDSCGKFTTMRHSPTDRDVRASTGSRVAAPRGRSVGTRAAPVTPMVLRFAYMCALGWLLVASTSCVVVDEDGNRDGSGGSGGSGGTPVGVGPVARNASEAWPEEPVGVPVLDRQQIAQACARSVSCGSTPDESTRFLAVDLCVNQVEWSAERAIPMSGFAAHTAERAELWVGCVLQAGSDCQAVGACNTSRPASVDCQEAGCKNTATNVTVTCEGSVATVVADGETSTRDCARAYATCDAQSSTGCTDRHYTSCAPDLPTSDRCDGDIRLGCDGSGQVSYHDCRTMGGRCGAVSGGQDCIYTDAPDALCTASTPASAACEGSLLVVCVNAERVSISAPELCP